MSILPILVEKSILFLYNNISVLYFDREFFPERSRRLFCVGRTIPVFPAGPLGAALYPNNREESIKCSSLQQRSFVKRSKTT